MGMCAELNTKGVWNDTVLTAKNLEKASRPVVWEAVLESTARRISIARNYYTSYKNSS
jgi:hypothetical protein